MPLLDIRLSVAVDQQSEKAILSGASKSVSEVTGKGEKFILVLLSRCTGMMNGSDDPVAFIDVRGIGGLYDSTNERISDALCRLLKERAGIAPDRIYLNFASIKGYNWGWNHKTFRR